MEGEIWISELEQFKDKNKFLWLLYHLEKKKLIKSGMRNNGKGSLERVFLPLKNKGEVE